MAVSDLRLRADAGQPGANRPCEAGEPVFIENSIVYWIPAGAGMTKAESAGVSIEVSRL
jgi:hypothetical protein